EWIELYNSGSSTESVTDWRIEVDENRFPGRVCARLCGSIPPFGYYLIKESVTAISTSVVADLISGTMAMGNAGSKSDGVQLVDDMGTVRDRILYGKPDSDSLCGGICSTAPTASNGAGLSRSTPGSPQWVSVPVSSVTPRSGGGIPCILFVSSQNGISEQDRGGDLLEVAQSPFSPLGDGIYREARILYRVPSNTDGVLEIYDVLGNNVLTLRDGILSLEPSRLAWDGKDREGRFVPAGIYLVHMRGRSPDGEILKGVKPVIVGRSL
ncbi:MAG: lamin tail domain-containing protein, partial [Elusimicrobia bacterium]|nr:lamin tail domain-containing protein [Elusimicrobiota bacterium]